MSHPTDPRPRQTPFPYLGFQWPVARSFKCQSVDQPPARLFNAVVDDRRSVREMSLLKLKEVVNTVAYVNVPRYRKHGDQLVRTKRLAISAGALHPISVVILDSRRSTRAFVYEPQSHTLSMLKADRNHVGALIDKVRAVLPKADGTVLAFVAEPAKTEACYENGSSLFWRDAGALMQSTALVASAFDQAFCPVGILGGEVPMALDAQGELVSCGVAVLGRISP